MALKIASVVKASTNFHVQIRKYTEPSASTGLANERTYFLGQGGHPNVPIYTDEIRLTVRGSFLQTSASTNFEWEVSPDSSSDHWVLLSEGTADFQSVYPAHVGECFRLRIRELTSASCSVDAWIS